MYNSANVEGALRSAERCGVLKLSKKRTSGFVGLGVYSKEGMTTRDVDGAIMLYDRELVLTRDIKDSRVEMLSSSLGS